MSRAMKSLNRTAKTNLKGSTRRLLAMFSTTKQRRKDMPYSRKERASYLRRLRSDFGGKFVRNRYLNPR